MFAAASVRKFGLAEPIYDLTSWAKSGVALEGTGGGAMVIMTSVDYWPLVIYPRQQDMRRQEWVRP